MKHHKEDDFDEQLQQLAPILRLHGEFRKHLRQVLRARLSKRRPNLIVPFLIVLCLGIIFIAVHEDRMRSSDLRSQPSGVSVIGKQKSESLLGEPVYSPAPPTSSDEGKINCEMATVRQMSLKSVAGWTLAGQTFFFALYEDDRDDEARAVACSVDLSSDPPPPQLLDFLRLHEADVLVRVKQHEAETVGTEDWILDTVPVRFTKWRVTYPEWGHVVYWTGIPLTAPKFP